MSPIQSNPWDPQHHNPMDQLPPNIPKQPNPHFNNPDPQSPSKNLPKPKIVEMTESNKKQPGLHNPVRPPTPQVLQRPNNRQRHAPNAQFLRRVRQRSLQLHAAVPRHRRSGGWNSREVRGVEAECRTVSSGFPVESYHRVRCCCLDPLPMRFIAEADDWIHMDPCESKTGGFGGSRRKRNLTYPTTLAQRCTVDLPPTGGFAVNESAGGSETGMLTRTCLPTTYLCTY